MEVQYLEQQKAKLTGQLEEKRRKERVSEVQLETLSRKLDELNVGKGPLVQLDGPGEQGSADGAGTSTGGGWDPSRSRSVAVNSIMERTVLVKFALMMSLEVTFTLLEPVSWPREVEALGIAGNNKIWQVTVRTALLLCQILYQIRCQIL